MCVTAVTVPGPLEAIAGAATATAPVRAAAPAAAVIKILFMGDPFLVTWAWLPGRSDKAGGRAFPSAGVKQWPPARRSRLGPQEPVWSVVHRGADHLAAAEVQRVPV